MRPNSLGESLTYDVDRLSVKVLKNLLVKQLVAQKWTHGRQPAQAGFAQECFGFGQRGDQCDAGARLVFGVGAGV